MLDLIDKLKLVANVANFQIGHHKFVKEGVRCDLSNIPMHNPKDALVASYASFLHRGEKSTTNTKTDDDSVMVLNDSWMSDT